MIYATPYDVTTKQCTDGATPVSFESVAEVVTLFGPPDARGVRWAAYGGTVYSEFIFNHLAESSRS